MDFKKLQSTYQKLKEVKLFLALSEWLIVSMLVKDMVQSFCGWLLQILKHLVGKLIMGDVLVFTPVKVCKLLEQNLLKSIKL